MPSAGALLESIDPDAHFITFSVTDGDSSRWPENTRPPLPTVREVNWLRKMSMDEKYVCRWRNLIGKGIAKLMNKPDQDKHCLQSFPGGYWMFDHNKGPISNIRHDLYLHGSKTVLRFRSPAEFIPHGYWLLTDPTLSTRNCGCKYCNGGGKKTQTEISEALGLPTNRGPTAVTGPSGTRDGGVRKNTRLKGLGSGATAVSSGPWVPKERRQLRKLDPEWNITSLQTTLVSSSARVSDLRSGHKYRSGELVWSVWETGIPHSEKGGEVDQSVRLWPAIIIDHALDVSLDRSLPFGLNGSDSIRQRRKYALLRLGSGSLESNVRRGCTLTEAEILPWHAHKSTSMSNYTITSGMADSFALALTTAENLLKVWAACDRLPIKVPAAQDTAGDNQLDDFDFNAPATPAPSSRLTEDPLTSIPSTPSTPSFSIPYPLEMTPQRSPVRLVPENIARANRNRTSNALAKEETLTSSNIAAGTRIAPSQRVYELRVPQPRVPTVTETRYQGLWYGAERIWTGDLVRLSPERHAFSKSLRLSLKTHREKKWEQKISPSPGAEKRGVLMRIDKIFTRIGEKGMKECAVAGPIYEIASEDQSDSSAFAEGGSSLSLPSKKPTLSQEPTHPWNIDDIKASRDEKESKREYLFDIPALTSSAAPSGYALRPLLPPGLEIPMPVSYIAGRYYPEILTSSLLNKILPSIQTSARSLTDLVSVDQQTVELLSLCALAPGRCNSAVCVDVTLASRTKMLQNAVKNAVSEQI